MQLGSSGKLSALKKENTSHSNLMQQNAEACWWALEEWKCIRGEIRIASWEMSTYAVGSQNAVVERECGDWDPDRRPVDKTNQRFGEIDKSCGEAMQQFPSIDHHLRQISTRFRCFNEVRQIIATTKVVTSTWPITEYEIWLNAAQACYQLEYRRNNFTQDMIENAINCDAEGHE